MRNSLSIDLEKNIIVMDRTFSKRVKNTSSDEYARLQVVRRDYPNYTVITRQIKRNPNKETYKGLTYDYMRYYIRTHESEENWKSIFLEFEELILISNCHSKRYPVIKKWFLNKYPEIAQFGLPDAEKNVLEGTPAATKDKSIEYTKAS